MRLIFLIFPNVLGPIDIFVFPFFAPIKAVSGLFHLLGRKANFLGEMVAPCLEQLAVPIENGDTRIGRTRGNKNAVFAVDDDAAAQTVFHARRQFAPVLHRFVFIFAAPDGHFRVSSARAQQVRRRARRGRCSSGDEITAGETIRKEYSFVCIGSVA